MGLIELTQENFSKEIQCESCIIQFWVAWCGPCFEQETSLKEFSRTHPHIKCGQVNGEENFMLADEYEIYIFPTILHFQKGKLVKKLTGTHSVNLNKDFTY